MTPAPRDLAIGIDSRLRWVLAGCFALTIAYLVSLVVRHAGSYITPLDGWGVDALELGVGAISLRRYFDPEWRANQTAARAFPFLVGVASISWALGDIALTIQSLGGATVPVPSLSDGFYVGFFPLCFAGLALLIRGGNRKSLVETSLDGLVAGLGVASLAAAYLFTAIRSASGGGDLSTAVAMAYPCGDALLFALAVGALVVLSREYRPFLAIASFAFAANAIGDTYNLLAPASKAGYVANSVAWPISLLLLATATRILPAHVERPTKERVAGFVIPTVGVLGGIFILLTASLGHVGRPAVGLATATLVVAGVRLAFTVREAQALNSARFRSLIDNAWDLIIVVEADFEVAFATPSMQRVLGYPSAELEGVRLTDLVHPDDVRVMRSHVLHIADGVTEAAAFETRLRHRNGVWRTIAWTVTNQLSDASVRGYVLNGSDVTEERQATEDLAAARDGALLASKAKSDFLSTMSHEIRTPMNGVIGLTGLLLETDLDAEQLELASGVKISAENLLVIVDDILDFSKIEAGRLELEETDLDVAVIAENVGRILAATAHAKGIELLIDVEPDLPQPLLGDPVRIQQVLLNLGSNAVKFTGEGDVLIRISLLDESPERVALRFEVVDMGIGIAEADQKRLFRAFAQADSSTTRRFGGTGLGLAICRQLIDLMGGNLGLVSAPGEGSTFWFELSLRRSNLSPMTGRGSRSLSGQRALIVDDNATNRLILRRQLHSWGVEAVEAVDGYQALELATAAGETGQPFDFGVVDLNMPGIDGIELAHDLKADASTAAITLFLLSSSGERFGPAETHLNGFAANLTKPVRSSELYDCLVTSLANDLVSEPVRPNAELGVRVPNVATVLLVEDNKVNQLVGSKVLERLGYGFDIANNGVEAVNAVARRAYDAVLMDCQMPEMDGYEATIEIRRIEGSGRHTPIIAMTAAAMDGDRDKCLAAGMDDYITKPVRIETVGEALERWSTMTARVEDAAPDDAAKDLEVPAALDEVQISLLRSLDGGAGELLCEIVEQFITQTIDGRELVAKSLGACDSETVARVTHTLKGASANVGAAALSEVCAGLETQARTGLLDGASDLMEQFDVEFARAREAFSSLSSDASSRR